MPWLVRGQLLHSFGNSVLDYFAILSASEDGRSLMRVSDVVHFVRVSLKGTTVVCFLGA